MKISEHYRLAMQAISDHGCDCDADEGEEHTCIGGVCEEAIKAFAAEVERLMEESDRYRLALESLTPGGSEYYRDPDRCVATVRERFYRAEETARKYAIAVKSARGKRDEARAEVERLKAEWKKIRSYMIGLPGMIPMNDDYTEVVDFAGEGQR